MRSLSLSEKEYALLKQVLVVPLEAFGMEGVSTQTGLSSSRIKELYNLLGSTEASHYALKISDPDLTDLIAAYEASCKVIDPVEMPTITGYSWEDSQKLAAHLKNLRSDSSHMG